MPDEVNMMIAVERIKKVVGNDINVFAPPGERQLTLSARPLLLPLQGFSWRHLSRVSARVYRGNSKSGAKRWVTEGEDRRCN